MEPRARQGIEIFFEVSVIYSLNLMTEEHTESTAEENTIHNTLVNNIIILGIFDTGNTKKWRHSNHCMRLMSDVNDIFSQMFNQKFGYLSHNHN